MFFLMLIASCIVSPEAGGRVEGTSDPVDTGAAVCDQPGQLVRLEDAPSEPLTVARWGLAIDADCDASTLPVWGGDVELDSPDAMARFCERFTGVRGDLTVAGLTEGDELACLESVGGSLLISTDAHDVLLANLVSVGSNLTASSAPGVRGYQFPSLTAVGGNLSLFPEGPLSHPRSVELPKLQQAGGVYVYLRGDEVYFSAPELLTVLSNFWLATELRPTNPDSPATALSQIHTVDVNRLVSVGGGLLLVTSAGGTGEDRIDADFSSLVYAHDLLLRLPGRFYTPELLVVDGMIWLEDPSFLDAPGLLALGGDLWVRTSGGVSAPLLGTARQVEVEGASILDLNSLWSVDGVSLVDTSLTDLEGLASLYDVAGELRIQHNTELDDISPLSGVWSVDSLIATCNAQAWDWEFEALVADIPEVGFIDIRGNGLSPCAQPVFHR